MKYNLLILLGLCLNFSPAQAQKETPFWAAGIYGHMSVGYTGIQHPFRDAAFATAPSTVAGSGWSGSFGCGVTFRKRWGLLAEANLYSASQLYNPIARLEADNPGYTADYLGSEEFTPGNVNEFAAGVSFVFPFKRWVIRPELMAGSTERYSNYSRPIQLKETGTHAACVIRFTPNETANRSPTLKLGARTLWYVGWYWGLFAEARLKTNWYKIDYRIKKMDLIEQTETEQTVRIKETVFGATAAVGLFLQIGRWEKPAIKRK